ncbi:MAG: hypothetical protein U1E05_04425 [Patescibacteria group bacterium]|nr:hypothetical protein [Patescibacteria group bacterium]
MIASEQVIDFRPVLAGDLFGPLRDPSVFEQVSLDPEVHTTGLAQGADFDPATLHDWPECAGAGRTRTGMGAPSGLRFVGDGNSPESGDEPEREGGTRRTPPRGFREWFTERAEAEWDAHIDRDERAGRLDALADRALAEYRAGRTRPL